MFNALFASLRLAIAIVCIGLSLVLAGLWLDLFEHPLRMMAFFTIAGIAVYWAFVLCVMRSFEVSQVVPDRVREALDTLSEGLLVMDERDRIVLANEAFSRMVGISRESLLGRRPGRLAWVCSEVSDGDDFPWLRAVREQRQQTDQLMRYRLADGKLRFFSINASSVTGDDRATRGVLATFRDVTVSEEYRAHREQTLAMLRSSRDEISTQNRELTILASQDSLTGCLNRRSLADQFDRLWTSDPTTGHPIACLMVDNDHFKNVNDNFGHPVGDEVLRRVSKILIESFPPPALVCRYGGEEFCVVLPGTPIDSAVEQAEQIRQAIEAVHVAAVPDLKLTASIGVSETGFGAASPSALIAEADECLYVAKGSGRNRVIRYRSKPT
ncbi:MraY-like glycosyltransferase [Rubripirellula tenax]|uniref:diguanylate cyclase n=1 Tax=Rubripirellula tenax TaxID=2528015 RepID=A0A5C6FB54_9BACT|nr:diguanylate cyclase [Rubripirellula tenax]TWU56821.1 MraY-like glycosyltransferase [Rubripirellula tenax]